MPLARSLLALGLVAASPVAAAPAVVADIAAIHSIVARVMEGVGEPALLLPPGASPHDYSLRPSEAAALESADIVVWVGEAYTPWLADPIATLAADAERIALQDALGLHLLGMRRAGPFADGDDGGHDHASEHGHAEDDHAEDDHAEDDHAEDGHAAGPGHAGSPGDAAIDGHLWLDPLNASAMATAVAEALVQADPDQAETYRANARAFAEEMRALVDELVRRFEAARGRRYIVFHDAYQYFENRFSLPAAGSIALHDADQPSPARMTQIRERIRSASVACAFSEPQFPDSLVDTAIEGTGARRGTLDPIGADLDPGPAFYPSLICGLADDILDCLAG